MKPGCFPGQTVQLETPVDEAIESKVMATDGGKAPIPRLSAGPSCWM